MDSKLTKEHLDHFCKHGFVVIENMFSEQDIISFRQSFHEDLQSIGIDHAAILSGLAQPPAECAIKSPVSNFFYMHWKMLGIHLHPSVVQTMHDLLLATFLNEDKKNEFERPATSTLSQNIFAYIDRVFYRLPNHIRNEKGLGLHLDRHPTQPFVTLTDHWGGSTGGLQVVPGFHNSDFFHKKGLDCKDSSAGEFFRMGDHAYDSVRKSLITVQAPKGSLVCWDNRLPHATCARLDGVDSREVVFVGFLPDNKLNREYVAKQRECFSKGLSPPGYDSIPVRAPDFLLSNLSAQQRQLLGF